MVLIALLVGMLMMISHPMVMVVMFMVFGFYLVIFMYFEYQTFWFSVLFMLVVFSGMMVLFMYMASLTPNDSFYFDFVVLFLLFLLFDGVDFGVGFVDSSFFSLRLWEDYDSMFSLYFLGILLLAMFVVVWLSESWSGCVRVCASCVTKKGFIWFS
uniref:NADH dehydrogenase subunit 6 n=2 Tax=unclassified Mesabolivar TaxID=2625251 RepID=A0A411FET0_9ARAC|nr:NADH dehydrogenase subunit 6 [Mesabolivar sp. ITV1036I1]YP_009554257.1 NADH dehydrogenase subunit 6 [Mesabolivar sp. ITV1036I3]QBA91987.1 NADH dehydrogenase subunit 6 [Mesabolivar sp. ITV1036I1]QBA92013.1 NADH dehydrogenase subunit 6 [Mesabolivar sp. ITV1036I3]